MGESAFGLNSKLFQTAVACGALVCGLHQPACGTGAGFDEPPLIVDRLPAKSFGDIFLETAALKPAPPHLNHKYFDKSLAEIHGGLSAVEPSKLAGAVEDLITWARAQQLRDDVPMGETLNLLHDVRDALAAKGTKADEVKRYLDWRLKNKAFFAVQARKDDDDAPRKKGSGGPDVETMTDIERMADATTGRPISANWTYARGAVGFRSGDRKECQQWFDDVVKKFPDLPRAEMAMFMSARCDFSHSRPAFLDGPMGEEFKEPRAKAVAHFEDYLKKYPTGRFVADALGWLGALHFDEENYEAALDCYIRQAETPGHPETLKSAAFMCERVLSIIVSKEAPDDAAFALVARHPRIAMGLTYHVLNTPESDNYNGKYETSTEVKKWRRIILPRIAAQIAMQKETYKADDWKPRYLAMLALAASEAGKQPEALELTNLSRGQLEKSDDILFARALALQRAGKAKEAIATFHMLLEKFPKSPLARGARLRLAVALQDDHQAGEAIVALDRLAHQNKDGEPNGRWRNDSIYPNSFADLHITDSSVYPDISGAEMDQIAGTMDALKNFAPLPELAAALQSRDIPKRLHKQLREVLAQRHLAAENFVEAGKYTDTQAIRALAGKLEKLTQEASSARSAAEKAERFSKIGDAWAAARGKLLALPKKQVGAPPEGNAEEEEKGSRPNFSDADRKENGMAWGFKNVDAELEERDELRHASRWWMRAARAVPGSKTAAATRLKALEAMPLIAANTTYSMQRAIETDAAGVSRQLYDRLRSECAGTVEAKRAAYWNFSKPAVLKYDPYGYSDQASYGNRGYFWSDFEAFKIDPEMSDGKSGANDDKSWASLRDRMLDLGEHSERWDQPRLAAEVEDLQKQSQALPVFTEALSCINFLDDLALFFREPNLPQETMKTYVSLRMDVLACNAWPETPIVPNFSSRVDKKDPDASVLDEIRKATKNPALKAVADYVEFLEMAVIASHRETFTAEHVFTEKDGEKTPVEFYTRDYPKIEKLARAFLKNHPKSRKREAAALLLAKAVFMQSRPVIYQVSLNAPPQLFYRVPFHAEKIMATLDAYDREFPKGRYAAEIRDFRGAVAWRTHDWEKALDLTLAELKDTAHPDLQPEAALRLANIFGELTLPEHRADMMAALGKRPEAVTRLAEFLSLTTHEDHPLRFLETYLSDQFHFKVVHKKPADENGTSDESEKKEQKQPDAER